MYSLTCRFDVTCCFDVTWLLWRHNTSLKRGLQSGSAPFYILHWFLIICIIEQEVVMIYKSEILPCLKFGNIPPPWMWAGKTAFHDQESRAKIFMSLIVTPSSSISYPDDICDGRLFWYPGNWVEEWREVWSVYRSGNVPLSYHFLVNVPFSHLFCSINSV